MDLARPENASQMGLHLISRADYFRQAFLPEGFGPLHSNGIEDILHELMDRLVAARPDINREQILADLLSREQLNPTFVGDGVCIPHTHTRGLDERVCVLRIAPEGTYGPHHVRLVFLLISPTGDPESHLATLAEIGRTCLDPSIRQALMDASSGTEAAPRLCRSPRLIAWTFAVCCSLIPPGPVEAEVKARIEALPVGQGTLVDLAWPDDVLDMVDRVIGQSWRSSTQHPPRQALDWHRSRSPNRSIPGTLKNGRRE